MSRIVNLKRAKKRRARETAAQAAQESRVLHGRTAAEKKNDVRAEQRRRDALDGHRTHDD